MMYLVNPSLLNIVKKQYIYKLKQIRGSFMSLVLLQMIALFFSFNGSGMSGGSTTSGFSYEIKYYSADIVVMFTLIWSFITAIFLTPRTFKESEFIFVATRLSSQLTNISLIITLSMIGAVTSILSRYVLLVIAYFVKDMTFMHSAKLIEEPMLLLLAISSTTLYFLLAGAIGYFVGMLIQIWPIFKFIVPALFIGIIFMPALYNDLSILQAISRFFWEEKSFAVFFFKAIFTTSILFLLSVTLTNRMEVTQ